MRIASVKSAKLYLYDITLENECIVSIDKTIWEHACLHEGDELDEATLEMLVLRSETHRAREKALYYLSRRDYGSGELISKLRQAGVRRDLAEATIARLVEGGVIDDRRYAAMLARDMATRKLYPMRRIAMALREKGFDSETIDEVIAQLSCKEEQQALELLRKKGYNGAADYTAREKVLSMLARYGFSYTVSKRALALWEEAQEE